MQNAHKGRKMSECSCSSSFTACGIRRLVSRYGGSTKRMITRIVVINFGREFRHKETDFNDTREPSQHQSVAKSCMDLSSTLKTTIMTGGSFLPWWIS